MQGRVKCLGAKSFAAADIFKKLLPYVKNNYRINYGHMIIINIYRIDELHGRR